MRIILFFIIPLLLFSCTSQNGKKVGLLLHDMEGRWFTDLDYLQKHAKEAGVELVVKVAGGNENVQLAQAQELVDEGVGVIMVVAVNQNTAAGIVRTAHKGHLKVIAYDRIISNSDLDYLLTYDYSEVGRLIAQYAYKKIPKGNYIMLWGDASDANARAMREGQERFLKSAVEKGDVNIVYRAFVEGWSEANAKIQMLKVLDATDIPIDVLMVSNDNMALAAMQAYDERELPYPKVITGQDAILDACKSISKGKQTMTIYKSTNEMTKEAITIAKMILDGHRFNETTGVVNNKRRDVPAFYLKPVVVDASNIKTTVVADGAYTVEQLEK